MDCKHEFIGDKHGVCCRRCGLRMTPEEYRLHLHPPVPQDQEEQPMPDNQPEQTAPPHKEPKPKKNQGRKEAEP